MKTTMKINDFLVKKFRATGFNKMAKFTRAVGSKVSNQTWSAVIALGEAPNLRTVLTGRL